jgi:phosphoglucomutase
VQTVETPTGFKWIADLGNWGVEESNGVGNPYLREKDGIFATVMLLKIILVTGKTPRELMEEIWQEFGRVYFTRGEVSGSVASEKDLLTEIFNNSSAAVGQKYAGLVLEEAGAWDYVHPRSKQLADKNAAWVLKFSDGNTIKARFSGTGSGGYTLRVYCSKFDRKYDMAKSGITEPMKKAFDVFLQAQGFNGSAKKYTDAHQPDLYA